MRKAIAVEFTAKAAGRDFKEESVTFDNPEELFAFISPGGGCEKIPDEVDEIQMVFVQPEHSNENNPIADKRVMLELGMVYLTGPLIEIVQTANQLIDKAGRGELSRAFLSVIGESNFGG